MGHIFFQVEIKANTLTSSPDFTKPFSTKFFTKHSWIKEIQFLIMKINIHSFLKREKTILRFCFNQHAGINIALLELVYYLELVLQVSNVAHVPLVERYHARNTSEFYLVHFDFYFWLYTFVKKVHF